MYLSEFDGITQIYKKPYNSDVGVITDKGDVYTWGWGSYNTARLGLGRDKLYDRYRPAKINIPKAVKQVCLNDLFGAAVTVDGELYVWGNNSY
ncbi:MAG: hypothetical protein IKR70_08410, partial [Lachnospiraceae bacterium]|nr:hypothetical protein [Lachnospiraceae bacterium]